MSRARRASAAWRYDSAVTSVLVVGAGPTGLTLACELYRRGVPCRIVDRSEMRVDRIRAVDVQARTLEVLERVGVTLRVLERGNRLIGMGVYEGARPMARLRYESSGAPYPFAAALPQSDTEALLELLRAVQRERRQLGRQRYSARTRQTVEFS